MSVCAEVLTADIMRRLARCLALIAIEITYLQIKCTDNMKASRGIHQITIQNVDPREHW